MTFSLELEMSGVATQHRVYMKTAKSGDFVRNGLVKITLMLFKPLSVVMTMMPTLLRQFRKSLQIKKCVRNASRVL